MDWIDSPSTSRTQKVSPKPKKRPKKKFDLQKQVTAALAQPVEVWAVAFEHQLAGLKWPSGVDLDATWLWSTVIPEQAEVLVRAGVGARRLSELMCDDAAEEAPQDAAAVSGWMQTSLEDKLVHWLAEADAYPRAALGIVSTVWQLPQHAQRLDEGRLIDWLTALVRRTSDQQSEPSECLLGNLVFHCELPLLFCLLTASSRQVAQAGASRAMDDLAEYLENSEDHLGAWLAHGATYLRAALASVLRSRVIADHLGLRGWYPPQRKSLSRLLEHASRWARADGTQLLGRGLPARMSQPIWKALSKQASPSRSTRLAMKLAGLLPSGGSSVKHRGGVKLPALSHHDDEANCTVMQHAWRQRGGRVAVDFSESTAICEALGPKGQSLLRGSWCVSVEREGQPQPQLDGWEQQCWFSDGDVDYLEMEARFGDSAKVQRQLVLFRQHRFMLAADALLCEQAGDWSLTSRLPLARDVQWQPNGKNSEGWLCRGDSRCLIVPLYLPEWRTAFDAGQIHGEAGQLTVSHACKAGRAIYNPVVVSLCNRIAKKPYTWRQLTVAEELRIVRRDEAVGYRLQLGKDQFIIYRNLSQATRRTLLGVHTLCDFYAALFDKDSGESEMLVEIEERQP